MDIIKCKCHWCGKDLERRKQSVSVKNHFCNNKCKGDYQRTLKPVSKEWLIEHYIDKKMNTSQIGKIVRRDPKSVWNWLIDFGIPTRQRGGSKENPLPQWFVKGEKSLFEGRKHTTETKKKLSDIAKASGRVPYDPKVGSYMKGRFGENHPNWKGGVTAERQAFYASAQWKESCKDVWHRADARCERCGKHHNTEESRGQFHIHHIVSFKIRELRADIDNLVLLCMDCHHYVHSSKNSNGEFIRRDKNGRK